VNHLLAGDHGLPMAVLVNDFGDVAVDGELVAGADGEVLALANGCICCTLRDDLVGAILGLLDRPERPRHVLVEASGVADPAPVVFTLNAPAFRHRLRLDGVLSVADATALPPEPAQAGLVRRQLLLSDLVLLNKVDLATPAQLAGARAWIGERARVIETAQAAAPLAVLLSGARVPRAGDGPAPGAGEPAGFASWTFATDRALRSRAERRRDQCRSRGVLGKTMPRCASGTRSARCRCGSRIRRTSRSIAPPSGSASALSARRATLTSPRTLPRCGSWRADRWARSESSRERGRSP
jgi:G3E family GTPase